MSRRGDNDNREACPHCARLFDVIKLVDHVDKCQKRNKKLQRKLSEAGSRGSGRRTSGSGASPKHAAAVRSPAGGSVPDSPSESDLTTWYEALLAGGQTLPSSAQSSSFRSSHDRSKGSGVRRSDGADDDDGGRGPPLRRRSSRSRRRLPSTRDQSPRQSHGSRLRDRSPRTDDGNDDDNDQENPYWGMLIRQASQQMYHGAPVPRSPRRQPPPPSAPHPSSVATPPVSSASSSTPPWGGPRGSRGSTYDGTAALDTFGRMASSPMHGMGASSDSSPLPTELEIEAARLAHSVTEDDLGTMYGKLIADADLTRLANLSVQGGGGGPQGKGVSGSPQTSDTYNDYGSEPIEDDDDDDDLDLVEIDELIQVEQERRKRIETQLSERRISLAVAHSAGSSRAGSRRVGGGGSSAVVGSPPAALAEPAGTTSQAGSRRVPPKGPPKSKRASILSASVDASAATGASQRNATGHAALHTSLPDEATTGSTLEIPAPTLPGPPSGPPPAALAPSSAGTKGGERGDSHTSPRDGDCGPSAGSQNPKRRSWFGFRSHTGSRVSAAEGGDNADGSAEPETDKFGQTALHKAAFGGDERAVAQLLRTRYAASMQAARDKNGWTALLSAACQGHLGVVKQLLRSGADPSIVSNNGSGALHYLAKQMDASQGQPKTYAKMIRQLLDRGVARRANSAGETPLHLAVQVDNVLCVNLLFKLASADFDVNEPMMMGWTPLHLCAQRGNAELCALLIQRGADPWIKGRVDDDHDCFALHVAHEGATLAASASGTVGQRGDPCATAEVLLDSMLRIRYGNRFRADVRTVRQAEKEMRKLGVGSWLLWRQGGDGETRHSSAAVHWLELSHRAVDNGSHGLGHTRTHVACCKRAIIEAEDEGEFTQMNLDPSAEYEIGKTLGKGAYGEVYEAKHKETGQMAALKAISLAGAGSDVEGLLREVEIMREVDHPNVVAFFGNYYYNACIWISMELCDGGSVQSLLSGRFRRGMPETMIRDVSKGLFRALGYLHSIPIVHRDIKPGNILLTKTNEVKIADFGVSSAGKILMKTLIGTPYFLAPEMTRPGAGYDAKVDVWAAGISLLHMAHGRPPFHGMKQMTALWQIANGPPPRLDKPGLWTPSFVEAIDRILVKDPEERVTANEALLLPFCTPEEGDDASSLDTGLLSLVPANAILMTGGSNEGGKAVETDEERQEALKAAAVAAAAAVEMQFGRREHARQRWNTPIAQLKSLGFPQACSCGSKPPASGGSGKKNKK